MTELRFYLELLYFASGPLVAAAAFLGLRQIGVLKRDIAVRNERAAKEKAIEYSSGYLGSFIALIDAYSTACTAAGLPAIYAGPAGDFTRASVPAAQRPLSLKRLELGSWRLAMNELEAISAAFVTGVADEGAGFEIIGGTFCGAVSMNYDVLALTGGEVRLYYRSIAKLYGVWAPRLTEAELEKAKESIERRLARIPRQPGVKSIGVE